MQSRPPWLPSRYSRPNTLEFFKRDSPRCALSRGDQTFADHMINMGGVAPFFAATLSEQPPRPLSAFRLQLLSQAPVSMPKSIEMRASVDHAIAVHGDIDNPQVHAQHVNRFQGFWFRHVDGGKKVPLPIAIDQIAFALLEGQQGPLPFPTHERDTLPPRRSPNAHGVGEPAQDAVIEGHRAVGVKRADCLPIQLVGIGNFADHAHHHLRRQHAIGPDRVVCPFMKRVLPKLLHFPCQTTDGIGHNVRHFEGSQKRGRLFRHGQKLDGHG